LSKQKFHLIIVLQVVVQEGVQQLGYELDEGLVEFGTAVHDNDLARAVLFLEGLGSRPEAEGMWQNLAGIAVAGQNLPVAARCYAALGNVARTFYLQVPCNELSANCMSFIPGILCLKLCAGPPFGVNCRIGIGSC